MHQRHTTAGVNNIAIVIISLVLTILRDVVVAASSDDQSDPHKPIPGSSLISAAIVMDSFTHQALTASYLSYLPYLFYLLPHSVRIHLFNKTTAGFF